MLRNILTIVLAGAMGYSSWAQTGFAEVSIASGIDFIVPGQRMGGGVAVFDYNNDGHQDVYITGNLGVDGLYKNNGDGSFTEVSTQAGIITNTTRTMGVITGDLDNDGYRDIIVSTQRSHDANLVYHNNGDGTFTEISYAAGFGNDSLPTTSMTVGDYNLDGYLDVYAINHNFKLDFMMDSLGNDTGYIPDCAGNLLYLNNGDLTFTEVALQMNVSDSGCGLAAAFTDFDNDGDMDIMVANDYGEWHEPNAMYRNDYPTNSFTNVSAASNMDARQYAMGIAIGDYDSDLDLDYYTTNIGRNMFFDNNGDGTFAENGMQNGTDDTFSDSTESYMTTGWGTAFIDIDNNTDLDLYVANGFLSLPFDLPQGPNGPNYQEWDKLFYNNGDGTFTNIADAEGVAGGDKCRGLACADFDADGDIDFFVSVLDHNSPTSRHLYLYRNDMINSNNYLQVDLEGVVGNKDAFGAHLIIKVGNKKWLHEVTAGSSHLSQNSSIAHFGLGDATVVDSLTILWPGGGEQVLTNIAGNQLIQVVEDTAVGLNEYFSRPAEMQMTIFPNPMVEEVQVKYYLDESANVELRLLNYLGQEVANIVSARQPKGNHVARINRNELGNNLSTGIYLMQLTAGDRMITRKLTVR